MWESIKGRVGNLTKMFTSKREMSAVGAIVAVLTVGDWVSKLCITAICLAIIWALSQKPTQE